MAILVGIAYYGMNPTNKYGEAANSEAISGTASDAKLGTKKQRQQKSAANGKVRNSPWKFFNSVSIKIRIF